MGDGVNVASRLEDLAEELNIGTPTLEDILISLEKPGRDPREELSMPALRTDILKLEDLHEGMILEGVIRNVVDFGAFVDIGLKRDGLIHRDIREGLTQIDFLIIIT